MIPVSAIIPTRGDVDMRPVLESLPGSWERLVWDNGRHQCRVYAPNEFCVTHAIPEMNFMGYGRHAAIPYASGDVIFSQDDDVIVSDPAAIVRAWEDLALCDGPRDCAGTSRGCAHCHPTIQETSVVVNMPSEFREIYTDSAMLGFGSAYHRDLPPAVFERFFTSSKMRRHHPLFLRESDRAMTVLSNRILVNVAKVDREFAEAEYRLYKQPDHILRRDQMLAIARKVRDSD